jgi:hypothetical protein
MTTFTTRDGTQIYYRRSSGLTAPSDEGPP